MLVLVLAKLTVTPPAGAAVDRLIGKLSAWPSPSVGSAPRPDDAASHGDVDAAGREAGRGAV